MRRGRTRHRMAVTALSAAMLPLFASTPARAVVPPRIASHPAFAQPDRYFLPTDADQVAIADLTGDGRTDVAFTSQLGFHPDLDNHLYVRAQRADGTLGDAVKFDTDLAPQRFLRWGIAVGDLDGDGRTDVAVATDLGVDIFLQRDGTLSGRRLVTAPPGNEVDLADLDGDGRADLILHGRDGLWWLRGLGGATFGLPVVLTEEAPRIYGKVEIADVSGDGRLDVVAWAELMMPTGFQSSFRVFRQSPDATFVASQPYGASDSVTLGDFTGDGRTDIVTGGNGAVVLFPQLADGSLGPARSSEAYYGHSRFQAGDVNGDGRTDLVEVHGGWWFVGFFLQKADGTFAAEQVMYTDYVSHYGHGALAVGDVSSDGRADIVFVASGSVVVFRGLPLTSAQPQDLFHPVDPARILDTRTGLGAPAAKAGPAATLSLQVAGRGGVPVSGASSVVLNVTVVGPTEHGYLTVWPAGQDRPTTSNITFAPGATVPNLVTVKLGAGGKVDLFNNSGTSHLLADVAGWYGPGTGGARYHAVEPARIVDTRNGSATLGPASTLEVEVAGRGGLPAFGVSAVVLNVTAVDPTGPGYLTAWPGGSARPLASNLNFVAGQTTANLVVVKVGASGVVNIYHGGDRTNLVVDVAGWYGPEGAAGGSRFSAVSPSRVVDTRTGLGGDVFLYPGWTRTIQVTGVGGIPAFEVSAVVLNVIATWPSDVGYLSVWPAESPRPVASNLNFARGETRSNQVVVKVGDSGTVKVYSPGAIGNLVIDVAGWFGP